MKYIIGLTIILLASNLSGQEAFWIGGSASSLYLTQLPVSNTLRLSGFYAINQHEYAIYGNYGSTSDKEESEIGFQYRRHKNSYGAKSFFYGLEASIMNFTKNGDRARSRMSTVNIGPRIGYSFPIKGKYYIRPQIGLDLLLGVRGSLSESNRIALPFVFVLPDFQLEAGYAFKFGT